MQFIVLAQVTARAFIVSTVAANITQALSMVVLLLNIYSLIYTANRIVVTCEYCYHYPHQCTARIYGVS